MITRQAAEHPAAAGPGHAPAHVARHRAAAGAGHAGLGHPGGQRGDGGEAGRGRPVLPLAFGEAGLPVHPALRRALAAATAANGYGPVAGQPVLRSAAAGYWQRRGLPTSPDQVVCGPGSKPLLFGLLLAIGADVAIPQPSWVSYAAQAAMIGIRPHFVPAPPGEGGIPDPAALAAAAASAAATGRRIGSVVVTLPDNPTGRVARPATVRALCEIAAAHQLIIISDEIYRDLVHDPATPILSPAEVAPQQTVVTTGLSKSLALGGWRIGAARMPDGPLGERLRRALLGAGSEIWSAPVAPIQQAAALAFTEPAEITERIAASRSLHATVAKPWPASAPPPGCCSPRPRPRSTSTQTSNPGAPTYAVRHGVTTGRRPGPAAAEPLRGRHPARQRVRRTSQRAAAAAGHRADLRRHPGTTGSRAHCPRPAHPALDRRSASPAGRNTHRLD